jgi:hypothetical protein
MAFAEHTHGQRCAWEVVQKKGGRPVVYVARGSQASFPFAGKHDAPIVPDHADGKGAEVSPALEAIADEPPGWISWPGRWGSSKARNVAESNSPRGPAHQEKWGDPETFHEECDEIDPRRQRPEPPPPAPPRPEISVRREGDRAVIGYRFAAEPGLPEPAHLLVTLDAPGDDLPPATDTPPVERREGEVEHPLPLTDEPYDVLVSAADRDGNVSEQATAELGR